jgi:hypothetical protein
MPALRRRIPRHPRDDPLMPVSAPSTIGYILVHPFPIPVASALAKPWCVRYIHWYRPNPNPMFPMNATTSNRRFVLSGFFRTLAVLVPLLLAATPALAKRAAPKPVTPVVVKTVEYSAPREQMGFVIATDTTSHKELWRERIYTVKIDPALERDVQDVFITSLVEEKGSLIVTNERGETYALDLATRKVTKRK